MSVVKDEYMLGQSEIKSLLGVAGVIRLDLSLNPSPYLDAGTIRGIVKELSGNPISEAAVILLDENGTLVGNTITGSDGVFVFPALEPGTGYKAYAKAPGFKISDSLSFNLATGRTSELILTLVTDTDENLSIITGSVQSTDGLPVNLASIELYKVEDVATKLIGISFSNEVGRFVFHSLDHGSYFLKINAPGYFSDFFPANISKTRTIENVEAVLKEDLKASKGIVTGIITDTDDQPLSNADVILYRVADNQVQIPVAYTRTNQEGLYLFVNVPHGEYRVNSNRSVIL